MGPIRFLRSQWLIAAALACLSACGDDSERPSNTYEVTPPKSADSSPAATTSLAAGNPATLATAGGTGAATVPASRTRYSVPVLAYGIQTHEGFVQKVGFRVRRGLRMRPLAVAVTEDTPGGSGDAMRASLWLAATVAALERFDELAGVEVTIEISGVVDGPSAGGVLCLALMSALDNRPFPDDIGMTGAILPDGTIGAVGGIPQKFQAAAKAGLKRVLAPALLPTDKDLKTGKDVDLKKHAADLGLEYIPVDNIMQAYAAAHRLRPPARPATATSVLELPPAVEAFAKKQYAESQKAGDAIWKAMSQAQKDAITKDANARAVLVDAPEKAKKAYEAGRFLFAAEEMRMWAAALTARKEGDTFLATLTGRNAKADATAIAAQAVKISEKLPDELALIRQGQKTMPESAAQLCASYYDPRGLMGMAARMKEVCTETTAQIDKLEAEPARDTKKLEELRAKLLNAARQQLYYTHAAVAMSASSVTATNIWSVQIPAQKVTGDVAGVERLFYNAFRATQNSFEKIVIRSAATTLNVTDFAVIAKLAQIDLDLMTYNPVVANLYTLHMAVGTGEPVAFASAAAAHVYATNLAQVSGLMSRWGEFEPKVVNGSIVYNRPDAINTLMERGRDTALANLALCKARGIPCAKAIYYFDAAELSRESAQDKVNVLVNYWRASLQAKVLLMLFSKEK